jgi:hypothetical protein
MNFPELRTLHRPLIIQFHFLCVLRASALERLLVLLINVMT